MKYVTLLMVAAALAGCAGTPKAPAVASSGAFRTITWMKGVDAEPFRDQHGVCHAFAHDHQGALATLGEQIKACFELTLPVVHLSGSARRGVRVEWKQVAASQIDDLFAAGARDPLRPFAARRTAALLSVRGFHEHVSGTCRVVVAEHADSMTTLGHEFKHCVDGEFHDERGAWRQYRAG